MFLIVDNPRVHHSVKVSEWVAAHEDEIELFSQPPYAPERDPDDYLNNDVKQHLKNMPRPEAQENQAKATTAAMRSIQRRPERVSSYFRHQDVRHAA